jgi:hypothetical protein
MRSITARRCDCLLRLISTTTVATPSLPPDEACHRRLTTLPPRPRTTVIRRSKACVVGAVNTVSVSVSTSGVMAFNGSNLPLGETKNLPCGTREVGAAKLESSLRRG